MKPALSRHLAFVLLLGALQGALGWYMVASGFADRTDVSQYRLVAHLGLALLVYAYLLWLALGLAEPRPAQSADARVPRLRLLLRLLLALVALTLASGGFVAGLRAGLVYNTFPLMDGRLFPEGYWLLEPRLANLFDNVTAVQFNHRLLAIATLAASLLAWLYSRRLMLSRGAGFALDGMAAMACLQVALGISTLLLAVPIALGALHQAGAILLLSFTLFALHRLRRPA